MRTYRLLILDLKHRRREGGSDVDMVSIGSGSEDRFVHNSLANGPKNFDGASSGSRPCQDI